MSIYLFIFFCSNIKIGGLFGLLVSLDIKRDSVLKGFNNTSHFVCPCATFPLYRKMNTIILISCQSMQI